MNAPYAQPMPRGLTPPRSRRLFKANVWPLVSSAIAIAVFAALFIVDGRIADVGDLRWLPLFVVTYVVARRFARWALPQRSKSTD